MKEIKTYKNSYGKLYETKEEAEIQERITKYNLELQEVTKDLTIILKSIENPTNRMLDSVNRVLEVRHLINPGSSYFTKDLKLEEIEKILSLITTIIKLRKEISMLENKIL